MMRACMLMCGVIGGVGTAQVVEKRMDAGIGETVADFAADLVWLDGPGVGEVDQGGGCGGGADADGVCQFGHGCLTGTAVVHGQQEAESGGIAHHLEDRGPLIRKAHGGVLGLVHSIVPSASGLFSQLNSQAND